MKNFIKFLNLVLIPIAITFTSMWIFINFFSWNTFGIEEDIVGSTLTTINGSDKISTLPTNLNANFTALNTDKLERSDWFSTTTAPQLTTLSNLSTVGTITSGTWNGTTLTVSSGGTGLTTLTANSLLVGNGTSAIGILATGTAGQFLTASTTGQLPYWSTAAVDQTLDYSWTGTHTFTELSSASTTLTGIATLTAYPTASSSIATKGYSDVKDTSFAIGQFASSTPGLGTITLTHNLGSVPRLIKLYAAIGVANPATLSVYSYGSATSVSNESCIYTASNDTSISIGQTNTILNFDGGTNRNVAGNITAITDTTVTLTITTFESSATLYGQWEIYE